MSTKVWHWAEIEFATAVSAIVLTSDCAMGPSRYFVVPIKLCNGHSKLYCI